MRELVSLNSLQVYAIGKHIALKHDLPPPDYGKMRAEMLGPFPQPVVLGNHNGVLWVDRFYVAYQLADCPCAKYVYLTRHHLLEEVSGYRAASKARGIRVALPKSIAQQFKVALFKMRAAGSEIWIDPKEIPEKIYRKN